MRVTLRKAIPGDDAVVHGILVAAFSPFRSQYSAASFDATVLDPMRVRQRMSEGPVFLAEATQQAVGTVGAVLDGRGVYIRGMAVDPAARRMGIGRRLLHACEDYALEQGAARLWLSTTPFLTGSIRLYESFGFKPAPGPSHLFGTPLVSFEKSL